jgi:phage virion morphogenesis protein
MAEAIEFDDDQVQRALRQLRDTVGNLDPVLTEIGEALSESTKQRFGTLIGPDGRRWPDNSPVTIERKGRNQPLTGEGTLGEQIHAQLLGDDTLAVGSNMVYAAMQQFGGTKAEFPHLWGDIPARPFLGVSDDDKDEILNIIAAHLRDAVG